MSGPNQKGHWEIIEPGHYIDEYQSQHNPSVDFIRGGIEGGYHRNING